MLFLSFNFAESYDKIKSMEHNSQSKIVLGLVGEKIAGKDMAANFLVERYGAFHIKFSQILDQILEILDLPKSRRNEIDLGLGLRKIFGPEVLYKALLKIVKATPSKLVVINGIRMDERDEVVRDLNAKIVYITASPEIRFERYSKRQEKSDDGQMTFKEFVNQEQEATEVGIPALGTEADFKIVNETSPQELKESLIKIVEPLL